MKIVTKKILPEWFDSIESGQKKYELRLSDFGVEDGDILRLEEWVGEGENRKPTGRVFGKENYISQKGRFRRMDEVSIRD